MWDVFCSLFEHSGDSTMQSFHAMCNRASFAQAQELPLSHYADNREGLNSRMRITNVTVQRP